MLSLLSLLFTVLLSPLGYAAYKLSYRVVVKYRLERYVIYAPGVAFQGERGVLFLDADRGDLEKRIDELRNSVICGDCTEVMPEMPENSVDAVVTDPPYDIQGGGKLSKRRGSAASLEDSLGWESREGGERFERLGRILEEFYRLLKPTGNLGLFYDRLEVTRVKELGEAAGFHFLNTYCIRKKDPAPRFRKDNFKSSFELAVLFRVDKGKSKFNYLGGDPRAMENFQEYIPSDRETKHPTEKPVEPFEDWIKVLTDEGDLVLDPFCGSGSALKAAQKTGREWIGIEKNPEYAEMSEERLNVNYRRLDEFCESKQGGGTVDSDASGTLDRSPPKKTKRKTAKERNCQKKASVRLPPQLVEKALELGIDVPSYCQSSLKRGVAALEDVSPSGNIVPYDGSGYLEGSGLSSRQATFNCLRGKEVDDILEEFRDVLEIDKSLAERTVEQHLRNIRQFLEFVDGPLSEIGKTDMRNWLRKWREDYAEPTYANKVKSLRVFFDDYLGSDMAKSLSMPQPRKNSKNPPSPEAIRKLYEAFDTLRDETSLLLFATSGLRRNELYHLTRGEIDFDRRMITPNKNSRTKKTYVTFYNEEAERHLEKYLDKNEIQKEIFPIRPRSANRIYRKYSKEAGIETITPQDLRVWFSEEMKDLGVSGEYIDAFCGRLPRSVRARHYTDYSEERLKEVYERAGIKVLD